MCIVASIRMVCLVGVTVTSLASEHASHLKSLGSGLRATTKLHIR